jgi:hypothetical protein
MTEIKLTSVEHAFYQAGLQQGIMNQLQEMLAQLKQIDADKAQELTGRITAHMPQVQGAVTAALDRALAMRPQRRTLSSRIKRALMEGVRSFRED